MPIWILGKIPVVNKQYKPYGDVNLHQYIDTSHITLLVEAVNRLEEKRGSCREKLPEGRV
mgnify:CR=1 FL=1